MGGTPVLLMDKTKKIKELMENVTVFFKLSPKNKQGEH